MSLVIDASIAAAWSFEDESTAGTEQLAELVEREGAWVPQLFPIEIANVLLVARKRGRIDRAHAEAQLKLLDQLTLRIDPETNSRAWTDTFKLASEERLTLYDATYLELALRKALPIATLDSELAAAAQRHGVAVLP